MFLEAVVTTLAGGCLRTHPIQQFKRKWTPLRQEQTHTKGDWYEGEKKMVNQIRKE